MVKFMVCPKCGSENVNVIPVTTTTTTNATKGFGCIKACLGYLIFNIPGILCGLCGMGKGRSSTIHTTRMVNVCQNCGKQF